MFNLVLQIFTAILDIFPANCKLNFIRILKVQILKLVKWGISGEHIIATFSPMDGSAVTMLLVMKSHKMSNHLINSKA